MEQTCETCEYQNECYMQFLTDWCGRFKLEKTKQTALNVQGSESFD